jgi:chitinase
MKTRKLLLAMVIVITFTGGFLTGVIYSTKYSKQKYSGDHQIMKMEQAPYAEKEPAQKEKPKYETKESKVLIGYVQDFRDPDMINYSELTHVIFSFAHPTKEGNLLFNGETALNNLRKIVSEAHKYDTKALLAVGGWYHIQGGESYEYFKEAITNPTSRTKLINELISLVDREQLDGVDIDFEHPRSNEDAQNLAIFIKELSGKLYNRDKELSIAVNAKVHSVAGTEIKNVVFEPSMFKFVDHVNIMAYDGQWDGEYNAANLSPYPYNENIVTYWTSLFDQYKLSKEKLVLGIPLYGQPENPEIKQVSYSAIINNNSENADRDIVNMNGTTYHYNGEATVKKKTKLAFDHGFGGIMVWETGLDAKGSYSLTGVIKKAIEAENMYSLKQGN